MRQMNQKRMFVIAAALAALCLASAVHAQDPSILKYKWSFDVGMGWDNGISGNINSGAIGTWNNQVTVVLPNSYEKVYGTGFHLRFGGGYMIDDVTELRAFFTYQHLTAELTPLGDIGTGKLYALYDPYKSFGLDVAFRRYFGGAETRFYTEGTLGLGFISEIDAELSAPATNQNAVATDFYDRTAAFSLGGNIGILRQMNERVGLYGQIGLRWMSGLSAVDNLAGTGLQTINDNSSRWTMPIVFGTRVRF
jgi:opacity protein-like surface antigen